MTLAGLLRWVEIPLPAPGSEVVEWDGSQTASLQLAFKIQLSVENFPGM